ncbi:hypothetical protein BC830DRAFT_742618 [Chytriomyces sp. MP71]|nr:hypothetical protein BC830DRAFT_742618 [Chytriomyces sp. MP71]
MDWTPAPPKMSLPLKVYHHSHSMPETPRTRSRQQPVETDTEMSNDAILDTDEADDEGMNFQDMIQNEVVAAVIKPVRLSSRGRTPLVDILLEDPTLESMAFNEDEWVKSDAIVVPDIIESDHQESARTSFDISVIPGVIQEENIVEQDVTAPTANISINIVNSVVVTSDNKMQQTLSSPLDIDQPVQVDESKRVDVPKNPRQFLSDNEASAKKSAPIVVKHNRSHSQPPTQKKKKKVLVSAPVTIVKKKQKKSRVVSASSESSDPVDEMVSGIGESNLSINMVPLRSRSVSVSQDGHTPVSFYKKRRMSQTNQSVATLLSSEFSLSNGTGGNSMLTSTSSFMRSVASSYMSISGKKEAENDKAKKDVEKTLYSEPVGPNCK